MKKMACLLIFGVFAVFVLSNPGDVEKKMNKDGRGEITSPGPPNDPVSAMYTLESIYQRLLNGSTGSKRGSGFVGPTTPPGTPTGHSYDEIMAVAPERESLNGAKPFHVGLGKVFWSLDGFYWGLQTGTVLPPVCHYALVPQTGQRTSYASGDDGDLQKTVAWPSPRYFDNSDGTITDNLSGLVWLKNANCFGDRDWWSALSDCANLADGQCGLTDGSSVGDWRLPSVQEQGSLTDFAFHNPCLSDTAGTGQWSEGDPFTGVEDNYYWTSTTVAAETGSAWYKDFSYNKTDYDTKTNSHYVFVWPVRDGP